MKDRFKFRIWDKPTSKMFYDVCLGYIKAPMFSDWVCADTPDGQISYTGDRLKDIEIMQCTGLKDKNGKLIYEGDILKTKTDLAKVVYFHGEFVLDSIHNTDFSFIDWDTTEQAAIGNIYENPELLEVKND